MSIVWEYKIIDAAVCLICLLFGTRYILNTHANSDFWQFDIESLGLCRGGRFLDHTILHYAN